jgi:CPA2 family monovalent cation:H+ antiporter-2
VLIIGFGINGRILARILRESGVGYRVIDADPELVRAARAEGEPIVFGDAVQPEILRHAGIESARVVVVAVSDPGVTPAMVRSIRELAPGTEIVARTARLREIESIERAGADRVVAEEYETAIEVYTWVLQKLHLPRNVIAAHTRLLRGEDYRALRGGEAPSEVARAVSRALAIGTTEVYRILEGAAAVGRSLAERDLRRRCGALVIAIVRDDTPHLAPSAEFRLAAGDDLVLVGAHAEIERAFEMLSGVAEGEPPAAAGAPS